MPPAFDAVVLAGGRGARAGGADKPGVLVGDRTMAATVVSAVVAAGAARVIMVGPKRPDLLALRPGPPLGLVFTREDPPHSGPVAALRAGLAEVAAPVAAVLAADLPFLRARHLAPMLAAVAGGSIGALLADDRGREQWLAGCWRTAELRQALASYAGQTLHGLMRPMGPVSLRCQGVPGEPPGWLDCDTEADLAQARRWQAGR